MSKKKHEKGGYLIDIRLFLFMESVASRSARHLRINQNYLKPSYDKIYFFSSFGSIVTVM
jgi:hypothetical protein